MEEILKPQQDSFISMSHNMTVLYPNLCYNKVCYKWTALYGFMRFGLLKTEHLFLRLCLYM